MSLILGDNFDYKANKPLDGRLKYSTVADMKAVGDATMYDGCMAYCSGTDKTYQWKSTNSVDTTTGRWREFSTGSGGSYTAGDGIVIDENDEISIDPMPAEDVDEVIDVYPTAGELVSIVNAFNRGDIYSTDEKMIGQWTDGKPLYQRVVKLTSVSLPEHGQYSDTTLISDATCKLVNSKGLYKITGSDTWVIPAVSLARGAGTCYWGAFLLQSSSGTISLRLINYNSSSITGDVEIAVQYTKTTDSAISIGEITEYSTEEKVVGTWIDGKPLYQKTFVGKTNSSINSWKTIDTISNMDIGMVVGGYVLAGNYVPIQYAGYGSAVVISANGEINHFTDNSSLVDKDIYVIVQYTKTT